MESIGFLGFSSCDFQVFYLADIELICYFLVHEVLRTNTHFLFLVIHEIQVHFTYFIFMSLKIDNLLKDVQLNY